MTHTFPVTLGDQKIDVTKLPYRRNAEWKKKFAERITELSPQIASFGKFDENALKDEAAIKQAITNAFAVIDGALDAAVDLLVDYAGGAIERETVLDEAYDDQIIESFVTMVGVAIPLGKLQSLFKTFSGR